MILLPDGDLVRLALLPPTDPQRVSRMRHFVMVPECVRRYGSPTRRSARHLRMEKWWLLRSMKRGSGLRTEAHFVTSPKIDAEAAHRFENSNPINFISRPTSAMSASHSSSTAQAGHAFARRSEIIYHDQLPPRWPSPTGRFIC